MRRKPGCGDYNPAEERAVTRRPKHDRQMAESNARIATVKTPKKPTKLKGQCPVCGMCGK